MTRSGRDEQKAIASEGVAEASPRAEIPPAIPAARSTEIEPGRKPELLDAPRGEPGDLTRISGIGPKLAEMLNGLGIWHHWQIASWGPAELAWVDNKLGAFRGRAERDDWVGQARRLSAGGDPRAG